MVEFPRAAVALTVRVRVEVTVPLAGGVTELGLKDAVTPVGKPEAVNATAELKPLVLVTVMVLVPDAA